MKSMFRYGISAVAFAAATDAGAATDYSKVRTHADLDAALGDRDQPEGWADFQAAQKRTWLTDNPVPAKPSAGADAGTKTAPEVVAGEGTTTVAEATAGATTEENPGSTTRADDPDRDSTMSGTTTAENEAGVTQEPNSNDTGASNDGQHFDPPEENREQAAGNRHSHPAQTEAERTAAASAAPVDLAAISGGAMPAGDAADPANQPGPGEAPAGVESRQDESGELQDATRRAIGAGNGAPDGVGDNGTDPSEPEVNDQIDAAAGESEDAVEAAPGVHFHGGKAKLWGLLEKGATHDEMLKATGYKSALGTIHVMAAAAGREIETIKNEKTGERKYKLKPVEDSAASE